MQVYGYYTDQGYWIYLRKRIIDNSLIAGVNFIAVISANPISGQYTKWLGVPNPPQLKGRPIKKTLRVSL
jgi:hypothetical protein